MRLKGTRDPRSIRLSSTKPYENLIKINTGGAYYVHKDLAIVWLILRDSKDCYCSRDLFFVAKYVLHSKMHDIREGLKHATIRYTLSLTSKICFHNFCKALFTKKERRNERKEKEGERKMSRREFGRKCQTKRRG